MASLNSNTAYPVVTPTLTDKIYGIVSDGTTDGADGKGGNQYTGAGIASMVRGTFADNASTIRTALGLGNSATRSVGTTTGTVAAGDDARLSDARTPTAHASSHAPGGSDPLALGTTSAAGLVRLADTAALADGTPGRVVDASTWQAQAPRLARYGLIEPPAELVVEELPEVVRLPNGTLSVAFDPRTKRARRAATYYCDPVAGNDSNDASTWALAKKTLGSVITKITSDAPASAEIQVKGGSGYTLGFGGAALPSIPLSVICDDSRPALISYGRGGADYTTLHSGSTYTRSGNTTTPVIDAKFTGADGLPMKLAMASSLADCVATPGTQWIESGNNYIHLKDGRAPDDRVLSVPQSALLQGMVYSGPELYLENIQYFGGYANLSINHNGSTNLTATRCGFFYAGGGAFARDSVEFIVDGLAILHQCKTGGGGKDGFNYKSYSEGVTPAARFIEIECWGRSFEGTDGAINCSTAHTGVHGARLGCDYAGAKDRTVHDVGNDCITWNVSVRARCATGSGTAGPIPHHDVAFACGVGADVATMYLDGCGADGSGTHFGHFGAGAMYIRDVDTVGKIVVGTLTTY